MNARQIGRNGSDTWALVFEKGDEVMPSLVHFAKEEGLDAAGITGIGAFERVTVSFFDWASKQYEEIEIAEQVEVLSFVGDIALDQDGEPQAHVHVVVGKRDGTAHGGHFVDGTVRPTLELIVEEAPGHLRRRSDPETGLALIRLS